MRFNPFSKIKHSELVGIDLSNNCLKIAHLRASEIVSLLSKDVSGLSDEEVSRAIKGLYAELKAKGPRVISVIPSTMLITKNIEIPSVNPQEIKDIINLQAGRHTPYSREEIVVDYIEIGNYKHSYTKILLVIVARSVLKKQFDIISKAGLKLENVLLASEGVSISAQKLLKAESSNFPAAIANIDSLSTDFTVVFKNKLVFIRSIPIGASALIEDKERFQLRFSEELKRSLEAYQSEDIEKVPTQLILTGVSGDWRQLEVVLGEAIHLPVQVMPYFKNLVIKGAAGKAVADTEKVSFLNVISCLLACEETKINLIPEEIKLKKAIEERGRDLIKTGIFIISACILIFFIMMSKIYFKNTYLASLNSKYQSFEEEARKLESDFAKSMMIKDYLSKRGFSLEVLVELYNTTPLEIEFNDIKFEDQGKLTVKGTAESTSKVFSFVDTMEKSKYFKDVKTKYTTKRREGLKDLTDFEIDCLLVRQIRK